MQDITVYVPLEEQNEKGDFYEVFTVDSHLPLGSSVVRVAPEKSLVHPKWDISRGIWVEDKDSFITDQQTVTKTLEQRVNDAEEAIMELTTLLSTLMM